MALVAEWHFDVQNAFLLDRPPCMRILLRHHLLNVNSIRWITPRATRFRQVLSSTPACTPPSSPTFQDSFTVRVIAGNGRIESKAVALEYATLIALLMKMGFYGAQTCWFSSTSAHLWMSVVQSTFLDPVVKEK